MVNDPVAQSLEDKGFWRRAATRWLDILLTSTSDFDKEWICERKNFCITKSRLPKPEKIDFADVSRAAAATIKKCK